MIRVGLFMLCCLFAFSASAQNYWSPWFSEEPPGQYVCPGGIEGARCNNRYCDNTSLYCKGGAIGVSAGTWSPYWISEERPNNQFRCPSNSVAVGMRCSGRYCDNISLRCDPVNRNLTGCRWSDWISEESGGSRRNWVSWPGRYLVGVQCRGSYCDDRRFLHCSAEEPIAQPTASWEIVCAGGQNCALEVAESLTLSHQLEESWSETTKEAVAVKIDAGVKILPVEIGANVTQTVEQTNQRAATVVRTETNGYKASCGQTFDMETYDIHAVWQWVVRVSVSDFPMQIRTCQVACRADGTPPDYVPGEPQHVGTCLIRRGRDWDREGDEWRPPAGLAVRQPGMRVLRPADRIPSPAFEHPMIPN
jgi:hypothetical protein